MRATPALPATLTPSFLGVLGVLRARQAVVRSILASAGAAGSILATGLRGLSLVALSIRALVVPARAVARSILAMA